MKKQMFWGGLFLAVIFAALFWFFSNVSHEILLGMFVGLTPTFFLWYSENKKEEKEHKNWLLRNKEACLIDFLDMVISSVQDKTSSEEIKQKIMLKRISHIQPALLVWGTVPMFHAYEELNKAADGNLEDTIRSGERFFRIIRNQLGHDDSALAPGAVWSLLLKKEYKQHALDICKGEVYEWDVKKNKQNQRKKNATSRKK